MDSRQKLGISLYALLYALVAFVGFRLGGVVPDITIYLLVAGLFLTLLWLAVQTESSAWLASALALSLVVLLGLLVVDPLEVGFYGYDPYYTLRALNEFRTKGLLWLANNRGAWPAFYAYVWAVTSLLNLEPIVVGKYIPLVAAAIPLACFVALRRLTNLRLAFVTTIGIVGIRTLVNFEMKFLDETIAATLFFMVLAVLALQRRRTTSSRAYTTLLSLFAITAILTHHFAGLLVTLLLCLWALSQTDVLGRIVPFLEGVHRPSASTRKAAIVASVAFVVVLLVVANSFFFWVFATVDLGVPLGGGGGSGAASTTTAPVEVTTSQPTSSASTPTGTDSPPTTEDEPPSTGTEPPTTTASGPTETARTTDDTQAGGGSSVFGGGSGGFPSRFVQLLSANLSIIGLFGLLGFSYFRNHVLEREVISLTVFTGLLASLYGWSVAVSPIIPLDPARYLLFMVATLLIVVAIRVYHIDSETLSQLFCMLLIALVVTQMALIPPSVWYSNQDRTAVSEGHYAPSQFAASDWVAEYYEGEIIGWESGVWVYSDVYISSPEDRGSACGAAYVWRDDIDQQRPNKSAIYNAGDVSLYIC